MHLSQPLFILAVRKRQPHLILKAAVYVLVNVPCISYCPLSTILSLFIILVTACCSLYWLLFTLSIVYYSLLLFAVHLLLLFTLLFAVDGIVTICCSLHWLHLLFTVLVTIHCPIQENAGFTVQCGRFTK